MITLQLRGVLGERFGDVYELRANTPAEAVYALCKMIDGLESFIRNNNFHLWVEDKNITEAELSFSNPNDDFVVSIALCVEGAGGNGLLAIVAGIAIVAVAWWNPLAWGAAAQMFAYGVGASVALMGVGMSLMPKMSTASIDEEGNRASYGFGGAVTTVSQGNVVPVGFGECFQGGFVITYSITSERID